MSVGVIYVFIANFEHVTGVCLETYQASKMELFVKIVNGWNLFSQKVPS